MKRLRRNKEPYAQDQHVAFHHYWLFTNSTSLTLTNFNTWKRWEESTDRLLDLTTPETLIKEIHFLAQTKQGDQENDPERVPD